MRNENWNYICTYHSFHVRQMSFFLIAPSGSWLNIIEQNLRQICGIELILQQEIISILKLYSLLDILNFILIKIQSSVLL